MLGSNQRPPPCKGEVTCISSLAVAGGSCEYSAYIRRIELGHARACLWMLGDGFGAGWCRGWCRPDAGKAVPDQVSQPVEAKGTCGLETRRGLLRWTASNSAQWSSRDRRLPCLLRRSPTTLKPLAASSSPRALSYFFGSRCMECAIHSLRCHLRLRSGSTQDQPTMSYPVFLASLLHSA